MKSIAATRDASGTRRLAGCLDQKIPQTGCVSPWFFSVVLDFLWTPLFRKEQKSRKVDASTNMGTQCTSPTLKKPKKQKINQFFLVLFLAKPHQKMPQRALHKQEPTGLQEKASCNSDCLEGRDLPLTRWGENGERKRYKRPEWQTPKWVALLTVKFSQHKSCCVVQYTSSYFCFICEQVE